MIKVSPETREIIYMIIDKLIVIFRMIGDWLSVSSVLFLIWVFLSWIDVITHNLDSEPVYQAWNFFVLLIK